MLTTAQGLGLGLCLAILIFGNLYAESNPPATGQGAAVAAVASSADMAIFHPVTGQRGMVASEQALASRIGLDVLKAGGNAVDAAVAVGFALAVVLPNAGNLGGGGFMMVYEAASGTSIALDFREVAPAAARHDMYLDQNANPIKGQSLYSHQAVGVPGTPAALEHALQRWGSLPLAQLVEPAIRLAEVGFPVSETLARALQQNANSMGRWPATTAVFWKEGAPLRAGERLVQNDLAQSLRLIATQGAQAFYTGDIASKIAAEMGRHGQPMTLSDLKNYRVAEREPVRGTYRGYEIVTMPPPSSGGIHLVQILNMMEHWPLRDWGHNSARSIHHIAEAMKLAYADRAQHLGDPDFVRLPQAWLISKDYARSLVERIDPEQALSASAIRAGQPPADESDQTTHYSVVDQEGNMVSVTYTLNTSFGSGILVPGTGILLNNEMDDFSTKPGVPNTYGVIGGAANAIQPGKRPLSSMSPTFVLKDGRPWMVTGSPGGPRIITTVLQQISNAIDFGMNPAEAASAPRFHHQWTPDELRVEQGFSADTLRLLRDKGQSIVIRPSMGSTQTIQIFNQNPNRQLWGGSDPRSPDSLTLGY